MDGVAGDFEALGRLAVVAPREVWKHEALDFTPWLLRNVDVLNDLLGMDLVLDRAEHPVGDFSLDLIGRDQSNDSVVIVENQLEQSDHGHLGQILTYAAGTEPTTIIWIASHFRSEHRAALDWLNERTDQDTRFFGVEIQVVRIGESIPAPAFKLVAQPNDWGKRVKAATAVNSELTEKARFYWDFWDMARQQIQSQYPAWTNARTSTRSSWFNTASGISDVVFVMLFSRAGLSVQLYCQASDPTVNAARYEFLHRQKNGFEAALGGPAEWDPMPGRKAARVSLLNQAFDDVSRTDQWDAMIAWLLDAQLRLRSALDAVGGKTELLVARDQAPDR